MQFDQACLSGNIMVDMLDLEPAVAPECLDCDCTPCRCDDMYEESKECDR